MLRDFKKHIAAIVIFLVSFMTGLSVFEDFGISWDEPMQRTTGMEAYNYVFAGDTAYKTYVNRDYGVAFQIPLIIAEKVLDLQDPRDIYNMRKLGMHLFFLLSAFVFYMLIYYIYKKRSLAVAGYLLLLITPRIYAQSFFNSKDIPFMSMFIICFFLCAVAFRSQRIRHFLIFGAFTGLLISIRVMGILLPAIVTMIVIIDLLWGKSRKKIAFCFLCYFFSFLGVLFISWPFLWDNPWVNFITAFSNMAKFRWDQEVLFFGEMVRSTNVSWRYVPVWFGVTTPVPFLILGLSGMVFLVVNFLRKPVRFLLNTIERNQLIYMVFFFVPILSVIILHSVLYDGWRQLYFIYPPFILLAVYGFSCLMNSQSTKGNLLPVAAGVVLFFSVLTTASTMIRNHPFEDVYFNTLVPSGDQYLRKSFELDYWGTSYKQALEYIVSHDTSGKININVALSPGEANAFMLPEKDRKRIFYVDEIQKSTYFISTYRWHPQEYEWPANQKVFNIKIMNSDICSVWKLNH